MTYTNVVSFDIYQSLSLSLQATGGLRVSQDFYDELPPQEPSPPKSNKRARTVNVGGSPQKFNKLSDARSSSSTSSKQGVFGDTVSCASAAVFGCSLGTMLDPKTSQHSCVTCAHPVHAVCCANYKGEELEKPECKTCAKQREKAEKAEKKANKSRQVVLI